MGKANAGHIIVKGSSRKGEPARYNKGDYRRFFTPVDQGSSRPAFCFPRKIQLLEEETRAMEKALELGNVDPGHRGEYEQSLRRNQERLDELKENQDNAKKIVEEDKDYWVKRRAELAEEISNRMPRRKDIKDRRVNPHTVLKDEKERGLGEKKREFQIISRALGEESNIEFLERD